MSIESEIEMLARINEYAQSQGHQVEECERCGLSFPKDSVLKCCWRDCPMVARAKFDSLACT